ncbi:carbonic anhydrase [Sphingomonas immobilis]|uniref:Carbonic anhydrase n=1 Tax=Sphingomonas immobilis TaxID=3063997 RepID=A0ABT8ZT14_9SPHN|nr:carbonic anhydrase [Sphingomonas sp. CA1-15]MDO7840698.1 carbonic anhydrase [Sphingomonas sp. CA1-15]
MNELIGRIFSFERNVFPNQSDLFAKLVRDGQSPKALMISCADSRIVPEHILAAAPGDLFVCRNAGNIVPPYATQNGGVTSTVEYAVLALGIRDIIVCGHSDCGAMKAVANPAPLATMPNVAAWLRHSSAAASVVDSGYGELEPAERVHAISLENVVAQLANLRTHPSVAAGIARGEISLHGWFVDIHAGQILALDGVSGRFETVREGTPLPVAHPAGQRFAASFAWPEAAE